MENEMTKVYTPTMTTKIMEAINSILLGNNGYADIGNNPEVAEAVRIAGFIVIESKNLHGRPTYKGFTKQAQAALKEEHRAGESYAVPIHKPVPQQSDGPDYEAMILARQAKWDISA
jgi:hypothetical protein